jgi:hypothetical protein
LNFDAKFPAYFRALSERSLELQYPRAETRLPGDRFRFSLSVEHPLLGVTTFRDGRISLCGQFAVNGSGHDFSGDEIPAPTVVNR